MSNALFKTDFEWAIRKRTWIIVNHIQPVVNRAIYIAGPMQGIPEFNYPAFNAAAALYRQLGYTVLNPAEHDTDIIGVDAGKVSPSGSIVELEANSHFRRNEALAADLNWIALNATDIHMLPGWEHSTGAFAEWSLAKAMKLVFHYGN